MAEQVACQTMIHAAPITFQINILTFPLRKSPSALNNPAAISPHNPEVNGMKIDLKLCLRWEN